MTDYISEEDLAELMAGAYALVYPSFFEGFGVPVIEAMKSGVPVLTSAQTSMQEVAGDAGLYFDPHRHQDIAEKLMLIYKDENLRMKMINAGLEKARHFTWERTASLLWESIMRALEPNK